MKRLILSVVLLSAILGISLYSHYNFRGHRDAILESVVQLQDLAQGPNRDPELLAKKSRDFFDDWDKREEILVLYISHGTLDHITQLIAELPALAQYEDWSSFMGRLDVVSALIDDLWRSYNPSYRNLL